MIPNQIKINQQKSSREFLVVARAWEGLGKGDYNKMPRFRRGPKNALEFPAGGQKGRGSGGRNFCLPVFCAEDGSGEKRLVVR